MFFTQHCGGASMVEPRAMAFRTYSVVLNLATFLDLNLLTKKNKDI